MQLAYANGVRNSETHRDAQSLLTYCREQKLGLVDRLRLFDELCAVIEAHHENHLYFTRGIVQEQVIIDESCGFRSVSLAAPTTLIKCLGASSLGTLEINGEMVAKAVDIWNLGQLLVGIAQDLVLPSEFHLLVAKATCINEGKPRSVTELRNALLSFVESQGQPRRGSLQFWLTPLPVRS